MIVPKFRLLQTSEAVTIVITAKYVKISGLEFMVEEDRIFFYCTPYHLKLCLPGQLESEVVYSKYDCNEGTFTFVMQKVNPGEHFKNLDLIIRLFSPVDEKRKVNKVLILDDEEHASWVDTPETVYIYGFAMKGLYDFHRIIDEYSGVLKVDPRETTLEVRIKLQLLDEKESFNIEHYEADLAEEESVIKNLVELDSPWVKILNLPLSFDETELDILKDLPNKSYNLTEQQKQYCYTSLIDILFAYCYDCRATLFEGTSESGWTIVTLAASLSWLSGFEDVKSTLISAYRRSLIYPLYRNFNFSNKVFEDLKIILNLGEICIIKCLLHIYRIFLEGDCCRYVLNDIFIKDYIIYVSKWNDVEWNAVVKEVLNLKIEKKDLNLNLEEVERRFLTRVLQETPLDSDDEEPSETEELSDDLKKVFQQKLRALGKNPEPIEMMKLVTNISKLYLDVHE